MDKIVKAEFNENNELWHVTFRQSDNGKEYTGDMTSKEYELRRLTIAFCERLSGLQVRDFNRILELEREITEERKEENFADQCGECRRN